MNRVVFLLSILLLPVMSFADISFEQLNKVTITPEHLQGNFEQQKYLNDVEVTLHSSGVFSYQRAESIHWETLKPIQNLLVMTPERIINSQSGQETMSLDAQSNPAVKVLSDIFFAVLTAEWQKLTAYFSLSGSMNQEHWQVELMPTDKTIEQAISKVELKGDTLLRDLTFFESNGNKTIISFDKLTQ